MAENLNLKKTILIEEKEYNINAVYSDEAGKVTQKLTLTPSIAEDSEPVDQIEFDGSNASGICYVPASGGKFAGPVKINENIVSVEDADNNDIINMGQIYTLINGLDGAPLYTWDVSTEDSGYNAIKNSSNTPYKLNTVIGCIEDLPIFEAYSCGQAPNKYVTPDSYDNAYIRYGDTWHDAYWNDAYNDIKNTITKLVFRGVDDKSNPIKVRGDSFYNMRGLTSVHLNTGIYELGTRAFSGCALLSSITLPDSITTIGASAFEGCEALTGIVLGSQVTEIKTATFKNCKNLKSIVVCNENITSIASDAFSGCEKLTKIYFKGTEAEWNAISNNPIKSSTKIKVIPVDGTAFPFLYICKEADVLDTSLTSNKIFLKLPGKALVEVSKGAARLERRDSKTSGNVDYFTYDVLAAVIAGINSRITALGSTALALPETLKVYDSDSNTVLDVATGVAVAKENSKLIVNEVQVPTVQQLQDQITKLTGGKHTDIIVPTNFSEAYDLDYDFSRKQLSFTKISPKSSFENSDDYIECQITFSDGNSITGSVSSSTTSNFLECDNANISGGLTSITEGCTCMFYSTVGKITNISLKLPGESTFKSVSAEEFSRYIQITFTVLNHIPTKYSDTVLKAKADEDGRNIKAGYYQKTQNDYTSNSSANTITISNSIPTGTTPGSVGDIMIVINTGDSEVS